MDLYSDLKKTVLVNMPWEERSRPPTVDKIFFTPLTLPQSCALLSTKKFIQGFTSEEDVNTFDPLSYSPDTTYIYPRFSIREFQGE